MKKLSLYLLASMILFATACEKSELSPSKPNLKENLYDCRKCEGNWDLTDSIP